MPVCPAVPSDVMPADAEVTGLGLQLLGVSDLEDGGDARCEDGPSLVGYAQ